MRKILVYTALMFSILLAASAATAQDDKCVEVLKKISRSYQVLKYSATFTIEEIDKDATVRKLVDENIVAGPEKRWARRIFPEGYYSDKDFVHIRNLYYERVIGSDSIRVRIRQPRRGALSNEDDIVLLRKNYSLKFKEEVMYEGHRADVIKITPRSRDRSAVKVCVDRDTGFIFYLKKYDREMNRIYSRTASKVVFNPDYDESLFDVFYSSELPVEQERETYESISDLIQEVRGKLLAPKNLPPGFVLDFIQVTRREGVPVIQFYYKDGLTGLSFFQNRTEEDDKKFSVDRKSISGTYVTRAVVDGIQISVVGDLPLDTLESFVENLQQIKKEENNGLIR